MNLAFTSGKGGRYWVLLPERIHFLQNTRTTPPCRLLGASDVVKYSLKKFLSWCDSRLDVRFSLGRVSRNQNTIHHHNAYIMAHPQETSSPLRQCRVILTPPTYRANFGTLWRPITSIFCPCVDDTSKNTRGERKQGKHQRKMPFTIKTYNTEFTCPICSDQRVKRWFAGVLLVRDLSGMPSV